MTHSRKDCDHAAVALGDKSGRPAISPGDRNPGEGKGELMSMP